MTLNFDEEHGLAILARMDLFVLRMRLSAQVAAVGLLVVGDTRVGN